MFKRFSIFALLIAVAFASQSVADDKERHVVYSNDFGTIGDGKADDTEAVQKFVHHVVENRLKGYLVGTLRITKTIQIKSSKWRFYNRFELHNIGLGNPTRVPYGSCLHWDGEGEGPMVEVFEMKGSILNLVLNNDIIKHREVDGFLWHNRDNLVLACNSNQVSLQINGCRVGIQLGDHTRDGYHSNIDDNYFPRVGFYNTKHPILIDSRAQDNNIFGYLHAGGVPSFEPESREYIIKAKQNGNGFKIRDGFIRTDCMKTDGVAIDIQAGTFSCGRMSIEGKQRKVLLLKLNDKHTRDISVLTQFTMPPDHRTAGNFQNSAGNCIESNARKGVVFIGGVFASNILHSTPVETIGCVFYGDSKTVQK